MHYIDLLNYLIDVQKIEKDELCELLAIPKKKLDSVLSGITPLKKKCLKNLSLYTSIPLDAIRSGNFVLNIPQAEVVEGEEAPKIIKDAYVPEYIREANTNRLKAYCKKRYKNRRDDVLSLTIFNAIISVLGIITSFYIIYIFNIIHFSSCVKTLTIALIPAILSVIIAINCYKLAWNGTLKEEKYFIFYTILHIIQISTYSIALVVSKWAPPFSILFALLAIAPVIYTVFIENKNKSNYIKTPIISFVSVICLGIISILTVSGEHFTSLEDERSFAIGFIHTYIGFFVVSFTTGILLAAYTFYRKKNYIAKHFEPVIKKRVFKGNKIAKDIITIILLISIMCGIMYVLPILGIRNNLGYIMNTEGAPTDRYHDYNNQNITFEDTDKFYIIENDIYSIKVPESFEMSSDTELSTIYKNNDTISIIINKEYVNLEETFDDATQDNEMPNNFNLKQETIERYGFFPKTTYENDKLMRMIYNDDISIFDRELNIAVYYHIFTDSILMMDEFKIYLYEDKEIEFRVLTHRYDRDDGTTTYLYDVSGNAKGNYNKFFDFTLFTVTDGEEDDVAYKIINSIEIK